MSGQLNEFLRQGLHGQELSAESLTPGEVTIGAVEDVVCSRSGFQMRHVLAEDGAGVVPVFEVTVRIRREILEEDEVSAADYALGKILTLDGREVCVQELIDREELPHVVLRCRAPGDGA